MAKPRPSARARSTPPRRKPAKGKAAPRTPKARAGKAAPPSTAAASGALWLERGGRIELTDAGWAVAARMAGAMCTAQEIADFLGVARRTLYADHMKDRFDRVMKRKAAATRFRVRKQQLGQALKGQPVGSIWWGKQHLGQRDKHEHTGTEGGPLEAVVRVDERLTELFTKLDAKRAQEQAEQQQEVAGARGPSAGE